MYVCLCQAVKDAEIREAIRNGHASLDAIADKLGVGTGCGCCREHAAALIDEALTPTTPTLTPIEAALADAPNKARQAQVNAQTATEIEELTPTGTTLFEAA